MTFTALLDYMSPAYVYDYVPVDFRFIIYYPLCIPWCFAVFTMAQWVQKLSVACLVIVLLTKTCASCERTL